MKTLLYLAMIATASAGNNVLLIIADDFGKDSQSLYNIAGGTLNSYTNWSKTTNGVTSTVTTYATTDVVNDAVA